MFSHFHIFYFLYITFTFFFYLLFLFLFFFFQGVMMGGIWYFLCFWEKGIHTHKPFHFHQIQGFRQDEVKQLHFHIWGWIVYCCFDYSFTLNSPQNIWKWVRVFLCIFELFRKGGKDGEKDGGENTYFKIYLLLSQIKVYIKIIWILCFT